MNTVNRKIIDAVAAKAERICPGALALIGVYGSVATGDAYEKSDLDLLILIEDERGWALGTGFLLEDSGIGYDIYCTDWSGLRYDAQCHHAHLSKLLDSQIVCVKNPRALEELTRLREEARQFLQSEDRFARVEELIQKAKISYADAYLHTSLGQVRMDAYGVMYYLLDALMLYHGTYFKLGVKRTLEELARIPIDEPFPENLRKIAACGEISELRELLTDLLRYAENHTCRPKKKEAPSGALAGTYEEMYSNWRNKVTEAAGTGHVFASFMNMCSFQFMLSEIGSGFEIGAYPVMEEYDPNHPARNAEICDRALETYEAVYRAAGLKVRRYPNADAFVADYVGM